MDDCQETDILIVTTTVGAMDAAKSLARTLIERRLAACVQLDAIAASVYRWEGQLCEEPEVRLTIKTTSARWSQLQDLMREAHPYELPQLVAWPASASAPYANWVRGQTP